MNLSNANINKCSFFKCKIEGITNIEGAEFGSFSLTNCIFDEYFFFSGSKISSVNFNFENCLFKKETRFQKIEIKKSNGIKYGESVLSFRHCKFGESINITDVLLNGNSLSFEDCSINGINVKGVEWESRAITFENCTISGISVFHFQEKSDNKINELTFWSTTILGQVHIEGFDIKKIMIGFSVIDQKARIRLHENLILNLYIVECSIFGLLDLESGFVKNMDFTGSVCDGIINVNHSKYDVLENIYTVRLLKTQAHKLNDMISYLKLYHCEMVAYEKELKWNNPDKYMLLLNRISNNYGQSWVRGIFFILSMAFLSLCLINSIGTTDSLLVDFSKNGLSFILNEVISILNVFNIISLNEGFVNMNVFGVIIFFISRILILYGGYQTIIAFRRFNRK